MTDTHETDSSAKTSAVEKSRKTTAVKKKSPTREDHAPEGAGARSEAAPDTREDTRRQGEPQGGGGNEDAVGNGRGGNPQHQRQNKPKGDRDRRHKQQKKPGQFKQNKSNWKKNRRTRTRSDHSIDRDNVAVVIGDLPDFELFTDREALDNKVAEASTGGDALLLNELFEMNLNQLIEKAQTFGIGTGNKGVANRRQLLEQIIQDQFERKVPLLVQGVLEMMEGGYGCITYSHENYKLRPLNAFVAESFIKRYGLQRGHIVEAQIHPAREGENCAYVLAVTRMMGKPVAEYASVDPFVELVPYYPLERILLECDPDVPWDNLSMRVVDLLTPVGLGQRGLIVAPPRTGKTVLLQCIANALATNNPDAHLIVLLIDERPEEVTDFRRQVKGEVVSSTFDETAENHVHAAEMVIEKSRRLVEMGEDVVILLDSITRLARAYNTIMPSSGKILSGGVEASALQKPKRFFGSARNIEDGGSLTIIATALVDTGSRMDEVIFEEFKGTGNMELHLDRALVDKRIFPAINLEKSGTRKEELLYHPDEMNKIYSLRRAMKGIPSTEAMEMLIQRVRKMKTNVEFLMGLNR